MTPAPIRSWCCRDLAEFVNFVTRVKIVPATADNVAFGETERLRAPRLRGKAVDARAVADVADAAQGHHRGAGRDAAGGGRRNGAGAHRLCRRHADAGRSDPDARAEWRRIAGRWRQMLRRAARRRRASAASQSMPSHRRRARMPPRSGAEASRAAADDRAVADRRPQPRRRSGSRAFPNWWRWPAKSATC